MNIKSESGITLLTLVVTIIVMVILATIVISASVGDNGLVKKTEEGVIIASIREVEEALDVYILLKEKDLIKNGDFSNVRLSDISGDDKVLSTPDTTSESGYNIYTIKKLSELNIKGEYGKGTVNNIFKIRENATTYEYEIFYIAEDGTEYDDE